MNETLWKRWEEISLEKPHSEAIIHWVTGEEPYRWTFGNIVETAKRFSILLKKQGIQRGDVCAIIIRHNPYFYPLYMGISALGAIPAVLAYPNPRLHPDKFMQGIIGMSQRSGLDWILTETSIDEIIRPVINRNESTIKGIHFPLDWNIQEVDITDFSTPEDIKGRDPFLLQHSSGTTGLQKPVLLSHNAVLEHVENYALSIQQTTKDKIVSWLPLYHDMGLIAAYHLPLAYGIPSVQIDPFEWVLAPVILLEAVSAEKATLTWLPNFAYNMMADKIADEDITDLDISSLRMLINCSEPVRKESHDRFLKRFLPFGLNPNSLSSCYAMAETTFGVTQSEPGKLPAEIRVDRQSLSENKLKITDVEEGSKICVSSGKVIKGCEIKIVDDNRQLLPAGSIGEVAIKSVSMFDGYRNYPEKTADVLIEDWYYSGDYGFEHEKEFYIVGRKKDIIISAGKNIYPEDVEDVLIKLDGIIPGRIITFGEEDKTLGTELVSVLAETSLTEPDERKKLKNAIVKTAMDIDITISRVYLVPPRWLIKSSAGKPSRSASKERILSAEEQLKWRVQ